MRPLPFAANDFHPTYVEVMPVPITMPQPIYPEAAKRKRVVGRVFISAYIDERGRVVDATIVRDIGGGCGEAALAAVRQWTFTPGMQRGKPVRVQITVPVVFKMDTRSFFQRLRDLLGKAKTKRR